MHTHPNQPLYPSLDEQQRYWDARWGRTPLPTNWSLRRGEKLLGLLRKIPVQNSKILDIGCGTGWFSEQLSRFGEVTGIDLSETAVAMARSRSSHIQYLQGNIFEMNLPREHYDVVVCQEVIAHVTDQAGLLERIADVLKPGGHLVLTTVNQFVIKRVDFGPDPAEHIKQWLDMKALRRLLRPRFVVIETSTAIPMGHRGILRLLNSSITNGVFGLLLGKESWASLMERAGLGITMIALAKRRN